MYDGPSVKRKSFSFSQLFMGRENENPFVFSHQKMVMKITCFYFSLLHLVHPSKGGRQ